MNIKIEPLQTSDAQCLLAFETENRAYFSSMVPDRGDDYYLEAMFEQRHQALLNEQKEGLSYFYLIRNDEDQIVGRVNVTDVDPDAQSGSIGYRVGESYVGNGIANRALQLLIEEVRTKGINLLSAQTTQHHIASQKVLLKNGFSLVEGAAEQVTLNGEEQTLIHFIRREGL